MALSTVKAGLLVGQLGLWKPRHFISLLACRNYSSQGNSSLKKGGVPTMSEMREYLLSMVGKQDQSGKIEKPEFGVMQKIASSQDQLASRCPSDSYTKAVLPLGSDPKIRGKYLTFNKSLRFGRLLEEFDLLASVLCYKHNRDPALPDNQKSPYAFVTALVDQIDIDPSYPPLSPWEDIFFDGKITWVGRSSMECTMNLEQEINGKMQRVIKAKYLFVARNPVTQKAGMVSPLNPETEEDKELFRQGEESKARRIEEGKKSVLKIPPSGDEAVIIHNIFLSTIDLDSGTLRTRVKPANTVWMEDTILKSLIVCQPEERNIYNKMFGGFLMRKAFELAWTTASLHSKSRFPRCRTVDDIVFRRPVEIGSLLFLSAQIVYSTGTDLHIRVHAEVANAESGSRETTNNFHFTFDCEMPNMKQVIPQSYAESMLYVDGKRRYDET